MPVRDSVSTVILLSRDMPAMMGAWFHLNCALRAREDYKNQTGSLHAASGLSARCVGAVTSFLHAFPVLLSVWSAPPSRYGMLQFTFQNIKHL